MGQRSQIYCRITGMDGSVQLIANYYQWNFGERMISRAAATLDRLNYAMKHFPRSFDMEIEKYRHFLDVNFDMRDIVLSSNIISEFQEFGEKGQFAEWVFYGQDNNDGKLFIDCNAQAETLTYCFTDPNLTEIMNGKEYLNDDLGTDWRKPKYIYYDSPIEERKEMIKEQEELVAYTEKNLEMLEQFDLMTEEELEKFLSMDYEKVLPEFRNNEKEPMLER